MIWYIYFFNCFLIIFKRIIIRNKYAGGWTFFSLLEKLGLINKLFLQYFFFGNKLNDFSFSINTNTHPRTRARHSPSLDFSHSFTHTHSFTSPHSLTRARAVRKFSRPLRNFFATNSCLSRCNVNHILITNYTSLL